MADPVTNEQHAYLEGQLHLLRAFIQEAQERGASSVPIEVVRLMLRYVTERLGRTAPPTKEK